MSVLNLHIASRMLEDAWLRHQRQEQPQEHSACQELTAPKLEARREEWVGEEGTVEAAH
jgi:hypothetical protein